MSGRFTNAIVAIVLSLLPLPALWLLDYLNRGCGDGLCGFFSGLLVLGGLAAATLFFLIASSRRSETPAFLRWIPIPLWALIFTRLFI
ncbi:MAG: hypothetical protein AB7O46_03710 [Xanthobacteraceae bacterium]